MTKPFASSADIAEKTDPLDIIADGVYALTAEGDPNVGAIEGEDFVVAFEARATPVAARAWLEKLRERTDKPIRYLVLTHYHAVRGLAHRLRRQPIDARCAEADHLVDHRGHTQTEPDRHLAAGQAIDLHRPDCTLSQIQVIRSSRTSGPQYPVRFSNQKINILETKTIERNSEKYFSALSQLLRKSKNTIRQAVYLSTTNE